MTIMKTAAALILLATITKAQPAPKENPTWFIPSGPKSAGEDDQSFCSAQLEATSSSELYQTRTSEILLPEDLEPAVCIIFPFAPNTLRYGAGKTLKWGSFMYSGLISCLCYQEARESVTMGAACSVPPVRISQRLPPPHPGTRHLLEAVMIAAALSPSLSSLMER